VEQDRTPLALAEYVLLYALFAIPFGRLLWRTQSLRWWQRQPLVGLGFGTAALAGTVLAAHLVPGAPVDLAAVPVALSGAFGGPLAAAVAALPPALYRLWLDGDGALAGGLTLGLAALLGALAHAFGVRRRAIGAGHLVLLALLLPAATLGAFLLLPESGLTPATLVPIGLPVAIAYPACVLLVGLMLLPEQQRARLQTELAEKTRLLDALLAHVPGMLFRRLHSVDGRPSYSYVSDGSSRLYGLKPAEIVADGERLLDAIHPADREALRASFADGARLGRIPAVAYRSVLHDGSVRWLSDAATLQHDAGGRAWYGLVLDVTRTHEAEEREHALTQIVRDVDIAILRLDTDFRVVFANAAAARLFGAPADELAGTPARALHPEERLAEVDVLMHRLAAAPQAADMETEALRADGQRVPVDMQMTPLFDRQGGLAGWVSASRDLSERTALQARFAEMAATDPLSGLPNRRAFDEAAAGLLESGRRRSRSLAVVTAAIDRFEAIDDRYGRNAGEAAIRAFAASMGAHLRGGDIAARFGGAEFVALLPDTSEAGGVAFAERLRAAIAAQPIAHEGGAFHIAVSFGVAGVDDFDLATALAHADDALCRARREGCDRVCAADAAPGQTPPPPAETAADAA